MANLVILESAQRELEEVAQLHKNLVGPHSARNITDLILDTLSHVEMFPLDEDTYVIDTPGFSSFDTEELDLELKARLPETFPEFAPYLGQCRFVGCSHVKEKGCAVLQAVKDGRIPASRHRSYVRLYDELKDLRDWQHK